MTMVVLAVCTGLLGASMLIMQFQIQRLLRYIREDRDTRRKWQASVERQLEESSSVLLTLAADFDARHEHLLKKKEVKTLPN